MPWLMLASYFFYGWWNPYYLLLVVYSTVLDYFARRVDGPLSTRGRQGTTFPRALPKSD